MNKSIAPSAARRLKFVQLASFYSFLATVLLCASATAQPPASPPSPETSEETYPEYRELQPIPPETWTPEALDSALQKLPSDRQTNTVFDQFRKHIEAGATNSALRSLARLRTAEPGTMVSSPDLPGTFIPVYRAVVDLIHQLPASALEGLADSNDAARIELQKIFVESDVTSAPAFILKHAGSSAALEAHLVMGRWHLGHGHHLAAELWLRPLLAETVPKNFREAAETALRQSHVASKASEPTVTVPQRNNKPSATDEIPQQFVWQHRPLASPRVREQLRTVQAAAASSNVPLQSTWTDRAEASTCFRRTLRGVSAIDLKTGTAAWDYPLFPSIDELISGDGTSNNLFQRMINAGTTSQNFSTLDFTIVTDTFCRNQTLGAMTSDDRFLYALGSGSRLPSGRPRSTIRGFVLPGSTSRNADAHLVAIEKSSGRRVWTFDRHDMRRAFNSDSPGFWIAGPPTVAGKLLYCVVEWKGEISLICLKRSTGEMSWHCPLAYPDQSIDKDQLRQLFRCTPIVDEGLIWCRTSTGCTACVDSSIGQLIWISPHSPDVVATSLETNRGRPVAVTSGKSVSQRWAREDTVRSRHQLISTSSQKHQLIITDVLTGRVDSFVNMPAYSTIVAGDEDHLFVGNREQLLCIDLPEIKTRWAIATKEDVPFGRGLLNRDLLTFATRDGSLIRVNVADGKIIARATGVLPRGSWGELIATQDGSNDILYSAPDSLIRLSANPNTERSPNPVDLAAGLLAAGQWQQSLDIVSTISASSADYAEAADIRFQCLLQLANIDTSKWIGELRNSAMTADRRILVQLLETQLHITEHQHDEAFSNLTNLLSLPNEMATLPVLHDFKEADTADPQNKHNVVRTVRAWSAIRLATLLSEHKPTEVQVRKLAELPTSSLLAIDSNQLRAVFIKRASEAEPEAALHLLKHSVDVVENSTTGEPDYSPEATAWMSLQQRMKDDRNADEVKNLLAAVLEDFPAEMQTIVRDGNNVASEPQSRDDHDLSFSELCEQWSATDFQATPISRNTMSYGRNAVSLVSADADDSFLRRFEWKVLRDDYGRLVAKDASDNTQWSIAGTFPVTGSYSTQTDFIYRAGSVLLVRSMSSLAAVSPVERRIIWRRDARSRTMVVSWSRDADGFEELDPGRHLLPSDGSYRGMGTLRIVGYGPRWLCIRINDELQMLDTFTGEQNWTVTQIETSTHVTATSTAVVLSKRDGEVDLLDRRTGRQIATFEGTTKRAQMLSSGFTSSGPLLVCFRPKSKSDPRQLTWIDPVNGIEIRQVSLPDVEWMRFVDDRTLAGFSSDESVFLADLMSGDTERFSYAHAGGKKSDMFSDAKRIQIEKDVLNFYITAVPDPGAAPFRSPSGRSLTRFESPLRAVDRNTKKLRWSYDQNQIMLAVTDQPSLPILVVIEIPNAQPNVGTASGNTSIFTGINKLTGQPLFTQRLPAQSGLRYLLLSSPQPNVLDVSLPGNLIRISADQSREN